VKRRFSVDEIRSLVDAEVQRVQPEARRDRLRALLAEPELRSFEWQYSEFPERHEVWIVAWSPDRSIALVYSDEGFGDADSGYPESWGYVFVDQDCLGMDSQWHLGLEHAAIGADLIDAPRGYEVP
jgi:hypothetical protein